MLTTRAQVSGDPIMLSLGEDLSPLNRDLAGFRLRFLGLSLVVLCGDRPAAPRTAMGVAVADSIRGDVLQVQMHGMRMAADDAPTEIRPLVDEMNRLLAFVERHLQQSRTAIGNLSHAVKTPLAAVFRLLDDPRLAANPNIEQQSRNRPMRSMGASIAS